MRVKLVIGLLAAAAAAALVLARVRKPRRAPKAIDRDAQQMVYFEAAVQYHAAARYAAISGFLPVSGNLFHHAVEMYMKGYFCKKLDESQLRKLGHKLPKIWRRFKADVSDPNLNQYDDAISELDRFERIRYPEEMVRSGLRASIAFKRGDLQVETDSKCQEPLYALTIDEVDAISKIIFEKLKLNATFFTGNLSEDALAYLKKENKSVIW
jgi:hypothetical protein